MDGQGVRVECDWLVLPDLIFIVWSGWIWLKEFCRRFFRAPEAKMVLMVAGQAYKDSRTCTNDTFILSTSSGHAESLEARKKGGILVK